jgi:hypothetical protein
MPEKNTNMGPIIGGVAVALIIIFGGAYYMLNATPVEPAAMPTLQDAEASDDPTVQATMTQSSSDELADIQADLDSTDLSSVDEAAAGMDAGQ